MRLAESPAQYVFEYVFFDSLSVSFFLSTFLYLAGFETEYTLVLKSNTSFLTDNNNPLTATFSFYKFFNIET